MIKWDEVTKEDSSVIDLIVQRALTEGIKSDRMDLEMDLIATHISGCPLDLTKLLKADEFNFNHDIYGIMRHIDRNTGGLTSCFLPRYALPQTA